MQALKSFITAALVVSGIQLSVLAQDQKLPNHVHYKEPAQQGVSPTGAVAPHLQKLGSHKFPVSTKNAQAQLFMNQGLNLSYAFNHAEAGRAYREAARLDPNLAMAFWGQALALGPNINAPMGPDSEQPALDAIKKADALRATIDRLKAIGATPPVAPAPSEPTKKTAPICPTHGTPMKASRKPGSFFCPRRTDDGDFCQHKA